MSRFWEIVFCVPLLFRRHVCLCKLKHSPSRELPLTARETVFSHLKGKDAWEAAVFPATAFVNTGNQPLAAVATEKVRFGEIVAIFAVGLWKQGESRWWKEWKSRELFKVHKGSLSARLCFNFLKTYHRVQDCRKIEVCKDCVESIHPCYLTLR